MKTNTLILTGMIAAAFAAQATVITFDTADGYPANGNLDGQPSSGTFEWDVDFNASNWKVVDGSAQITSLTPNFQGARWTESFGGTNIAQSANLTFTRTVEAPTDSKSLFFVGINELAVLGGKSASVAIRQINTGSDIYQLYFFENVGTQDTSSSANFNGAAIGLTAGGEATTALLTLDLVHTYNGSDSWTTSAVLNNGATEVATLTKTWSADGGPTGWSDADKYLQLTAANINDTTGITVNFDQVSIIPEPATLGLFVISSAGVLLGRRVLHN
jgi:hypothetical protein